MAEGLFNALAPAGWEARSAGTDPEGQVRSEAIAALAEIGIDIRHHHPKSIDEAMAPDVRLLVGLCAEEACPVVPGVPSVHWPLANPAGQAPAVYRAVRDDLAERIRGLIRELAPRRA
jgi:arsenate reductase